GFNADRRVLADHRPADYFLVGGIADADRFGQLNQPLHELRGDLVVGEHALHLDADLPRVGERARHDALGGVLDVAVGLDNHGGVAPQLKQHGLARRQLAQVPADAIAAGEADDGHAFVGGEYLGDVVLTGQ